MINNETKKLITDYLLEWLHQATQKKSYSNGQEEKSKDGKQKPFHEALLPEHIIRSSSFERSMSTGLGKTFEESAKLIALQNYKIADTQKETTGLVSERAIKEIENMANSVKNVGRPKNYLELVKKIISIDDKPTQTRRSISDLYLMDNDDNEIFFELKSPKPNKGQCVEVLERQLLIHAIKKEGPPKARTYYGMTYNPWGTSKSDFKHPFAIKYLDMENHVLLGKEFWDFLGGDGTYEEIVKIYQKIGVKPADLIFQKKLSEGIEEAKKSSKND